MAQVRTLDTILEEAEGLLAKAASLWGMDETSTTLVATPLLADIAQCVEDSTRPRRRHLYANAIHPLGPVSLDTLSTTLKRCLDEARDVLIGYRDITLPQAVAAGQTGCVSLRTFSSLLKAKATLYADVRRLRDITQHCQKKITDACQDDASRRKRMVAQLESIAKQHGLESYCDESTQGQPHTTVMLAGAVVELKGIDQMEAKVTYALPEDPPASATTIDCSLLGQLLTRTLKSGDLASFEEQIAWLAAVDRYTKSNDQVDFFHCMRVIRQDMSTIFQREMSICSGDISTVLLYGHGLPLSDRVHPGPAVAYWAPRALLVGTDWERVSRCLTVSEDDNIDTDIDSLKSFHYFHLQLELSSTSHNFLSKKQTTYLAPPTKEASNTDLSTINTDTEETQYVSEDSAALLNAPLKFIVPNTPASIQCTAWLSPGVVLTSTMAAELTRVIGLNTNLENTMPQLDTLDSSLSFYEALVRESTNEPLSKQQPLYFTDQMAFRTKLPASSIVHEYALVSSPPTVGIWLQRIPVSHLYQWAKIERLIRQQLVFNALFKSCFSAEMAHVLDPVTRRPFTAKESELDDEIPIEHPLWIDESIRVEVAVHHPPHAFLLSFLPPNMADYICLEVSVSAENALPAVKRLADFSTAAPTAIGDMHTSMNDEQAAMLDAICHEQKMTQVIRASESVPLLIHWLLCRFDEHGRMEWAGDM
ncbi:hypothetical protein BDF19DRAFT_424401 [Syncephalis fuscata]|nr:hypothetical protein BDF19DRAFT_424401 [Syncephalis fuscata]